MWWQLMTTNSTRTVIKSGTYFITGTDTDVGKTICTKALLQAAKNQHANTLAYKPIAAGCDKTSAGLRNEDALILQSSCTMTCDYDLINPISFEQPIAPHIAADEVGDNISLSIINDGLNLLQKRRADYLLVEGAGGWHLPIDKQMLLSEWVAEQKIPVILVVGLKLGCLNHALLTAQAIERSGLQIIGWIANHLAHDMPYATQNITTLKHLINAPLIGEIPFLDDINERDLSNYINVEFNR